VLGVHYRRLDGVLMLFFLVVIVTDACFLVDASQPVRSAGFVQDCLSQRCFAAAGVTQQNNIANIFGICHF
jgi:hypothetical protein